MEKESNFKNLVITVVYFFLSIPLALVMEGSRRIMNPKWRIILCFTSSAD